MPLSTCVPSVSNNVTNQGGATSDAIPVFDDGDARAVVDLATYVSDSPEVTMF